MPWGLRLVSAGNARKRGVIAGGGGLVRPVLLTLIIRRVGGMRMQRGGTILRMERMLGRMVVHRK
jgi:hypothetical protein